MKKILCLLLFIFLVLPVQAVTLEGSVTYTVEQAREEAFKDIEWEIPKQLLRKHRKDPNYRVNVVAKKYSQNVLTDRYITFFSDGGYCIMYFDDMYHAFHYDESGKLESIQVFTTTQLPYKSYRYGVDGKLQRIFWHISKYKSYAFNPDGTLYGYWEDDTAYNLKGNVFLKRFNY